jgi:hypothetical protein
LGGPDARIMIPPKPWLSHRAIRPGSHAVDKARTVMHTIPHTEPRRLKSRSAIALDAWPGQRPAAGEHARGGYARPKAATPGWGPGGRRFNPVSPTTQKACNRRPFVSGEPVVRCPPWNNYETNSVRSASRCPHAGFRTARARSVMGPDASASDRFEARRAMALESLVEAAQLEVVDRVGPVSVVPPKLDDGDPTLARQSIHVARWDLPAPGQLLGSQQLGSRDGAHNVLGGSLPRLVARNLQRVQAEPDARRRMTPIRLPETEQLGSWMTRSLTRVFRSKPL